MIGKLQEKYPFLDPTQARKQIRQKVRPYLTQLDAQPRKHRMAALGIGVFLIYALTDLFFLSPNARHLEETKTKIEAANAKIKKLEDQKHKIEQERELDPDLALKDERERLTARIGQLDEQLDQLTVGLISPSEMSGMLEDMLGEVQDLTLERLETLPAEPVVRSIQKAEPGVEDTGGRYYRHAVEIELTGGYFSTLRYLEMLESLPWDFFWDELSYSVEEYPLAKIRLRIHTLSTKKEWIGV